MAIPQKLATELVAASNLISGEGELPAISRKKILQLIEELSSVEHANAGYLRRARLALICGREFVSHMGPYADVQGRARMMLAHGFSAISGKCDLKLLQKENGNFHTSVVDLFEHGDVAFVAAYAGMATFSAVNTVLYDTNFDLFGENEQNVPPDDWDASYYASLAVSGSAVWENKVGGE
ncbi:Imm5 family immunity protein [Ralstonia pseudosolanacearum]